MTGSAPIPAETLHTRDAGVAATLNMLAAVGAERGRQNTKWGSPSTNTNIDTSLVKNASTPHRVALFYEIPCAARAKRLCDDAARAGRCTWAHVLIEEVAEVVEAATFHDRAVQRGVQTGGDLVAELIQVAAVAVGWAEAITAGSAPASGAAAQGPDQNCEKTCATSPASTSALSNRCAATDSTTRMDPHVTTH